MGATDELVRASGAQHSEPGRSFGGERSGDREGKSAFAIAAELVKSDRTGRTKKRSRSRSRSRSNAKRRKKRRSSSDDSSKSRGKSAERSKTVGRTRKSIF